MLIMMTIVKGMHNIQNNHLLLLLQSERKNEALTCGIRIWRESKKE